MGAGGSPLGWLVADAEVTLRGGATLALHPSPDFVSDAIRASGDYYERNILDEVVGRLNRGTVVDGGAMIGNHSLFLAHHRAGLWIHAFEPVPANLELLRRNVARCTHVIVHPQALSDVPGRVTMRLEPGNLGHSLIEEGGALEVEAIALDSLALEDVVLVKLDLEGHEGPALEGAVATIERWRPLILLEDWQLVYGHRLGELGYALERAWPTQQTYLWKWAG